MNKKRIHYLIFSCIAFLLVPVYFQAQEAPSIAGHWEGIIDVPGTKLEILIDFNQKQDGTWEGRISIPSQNAKNLPLSDISFMDKEATFAIAGVPGEPTFKGTISDNGTKIEGDFTQGGQSFSFSLSLEVSPKIKAKKALAGFDEMYSVSFKNL